MPWLLVLTFNLFLGEQVFVFFFFSFLTFVQLLSRKSWRVLFVVSLLEACVIYYGMTGLKDVASKLKNIEPEMNIALRQAGLGSCKVLTGICVAKGSSKFSIPLPDPAKYPTPPPDFRSAFQLFPYWIWIDILKPQAQGQDSVWKVPEFGDSPGRDSPGRDSPGRDSPGCAATHSVSSEASSPRDDFASLQLPDTQLEEELPRTEGKVEDSDVYGHDTTFESKPTFESDFSSTFGTSGSTFAPTKFG